MSFFFKKIKKERKEPIESSCVNRSSSQTIIYFCPFTAVFKIQGSAILVEGKEYQLQYYIRIPSQKGNGEKMLFQTKIT